MSALTLAQRAGVAESTIRAHENGQNDIRPKAAERYADILRGAPEWILYGTGDVAAVAPEETSTTPPHFARAWREYRGLSEAELAERMGTAEQVIKDVEAGAAPLSGKRLDEMAAALVTTPGRIREVNPNDVPPDALDAFGQIAPEHRAAAVAMLRGLAADKK